MTYKEAIVESLNRLGGHATLSDIYDTFEHVYTGTLSSSWKDQVRKCIQMNSSDSIIFDGRNDLFYSVGGLGKGIWGLRNYKGSIELTQEDDLYSEGKKYLREHLRRERNVKLIATAKQRFIARHDHLYCEVCGFDFYQVYGELGENFIEAHHIKPVSEMAEGEKTRVEDIIMVCSNCHSMIHRRKPWLKADEIKGIICEEESV